MTAAPGIAILHEDEDLLVLDKPAGINVIPGRNEPPTASLRHELERFLSEREAAKRRVWVVHRLDRDVSGALAFALGAAAHRALSMAYERGEVEKRYWALVEGVVRDDAGMVELPLRTGGHGGRTVVDPRHGRPARTRFRVLRRFLRYTALEVEPLTGRTHQIRVHLKAIGHPLVVDRRYGKRAAVTVSELRDEPAGDGELPLVARATLHAERLVLPLRFGGRLEVRAPLAADLEALLLAL